MGIMYTLIDDMMSNLAPSSFSEVLVLKHIPQDPNHHPEGNAYIHTLLVMEAMNDLLLPNLRDVYSYRVLMNAAMCHDLGKATTTEIHEDGRITAYGHDDAGVEPTIVLLNRLGVEQSIIDTVIPLVKEHMVHASFSRGLPTNRAIRRLARRLQPSNTEMWALLVEADASGRNRGNVFPFVAQYILTRARELGISEGILRPTDIETDEVWQHRGYARNPIFLQDDKYYHTDELWSGLIGPFDRYYDAVKALEVYVKGL